MRVQEGKEMDFIGYKLNDIIYLAEQTEPARQDDWQAYAQSILRIIAREARDAKAALTALAMTNGSQK